MLAPVAPHRLPGVRMTAKTVSQQRPAGAPEIDRRAAERYRCLCECLARLEGAPLAADWPGMVYNLSTDGAGLALPFPAPLGSVLVIERRTPRRRVKTLRARVV